MKDIKNIFRNLEKQVKQSVWFDDDWEIYNRGTYFQLYKRNWHNQNQGGIHFETFIESAQIKQKAFPICMHVEEDCPSQSTFIKNFLEIERDRIESWKRYQIVGRGYVVFQRAVPLNFKNLEQRLYEELIRLRQLESSVDKALAML
jgi:hypothetical protein|tara:strand:+ start:5804 stop:6241 length:438 start_codon:yes stop_codon:yes gene_type:complete